MRIIAAALRCFAAGAASAQPAPAAAYPISEVDRPIVHPSGMTVLDVSLDLPTYYVTTVDAMGNAATDTTALGHDHDLDITVSHALGPVDLSARVVGSYLDGAASIRVSQSGQIQLGVDWELPQHDVRYAAEQYASYGYKLVVIPGSLALGAHAGASLNEILLTPVMEPHISGQIVTLFGGAGPEIQITPRLALSGRAVVTVPVANSTRLLPATTWDLGSELLFAFARWDLYADLGLDDATHLGRLFAAAGVVHRWGG